MRTDKGKITKSLKNSLESEKDTFDFDCVDDFTNVYICQNIKLNTLDTHQLYPSTGVKDPTNKENTNWKSYWPIKDHYSS